MKKINESILCAGFGGQGIMILGKVLATAGMTEGYDVTWLPCYGAEVRGGTAYAMVRMRAGHIGSPVVGHADTAIIMNEPSLDKFEGNLKPGGLLILNTSVCSRSPGRKDIRIVGAPLTDEAIKLGTGKVANMIAAGIFMAQKPVLDKEVMFDVIKEMAGDRKELVDINMKAVERGMEIGKW